MYVNKVFSQRRNYLNGKRLPTYLITGSFQNACHNSLVVIL